MPNAIIKNLSASFRILLGLVMIFCIFLALKIPYSKNIPLSKTGENLWQTHITNHPYLKNDLKQKLAQQYYEQALQAQQASKDYLIDSSLIQARKYSQELSLSHKIDGWTASRKISQWLNPNYLEDKTLYTIQTGDSLSKIATKHQTTLRNIYYLNGMSNLNLYAGKQLTLKPLNYQLIINIKENSLSLYNEQQFLCSFPVEIITNRTHIKRKTTYIIGQFLAQKNTTTYQLRKSGYLESFKRFRVKSIQLDISDNRFKDPTTEIDGIYLNPLDMEDLSLLLREGNTITFI